MVSLWYDTYQAICQFENAVMRQTLREALGIGHWALPACAETLGVTAGAPQRMARLPTLPHCRILKLPHCHITALPNCLIASLPTVLDHAHSHPMDGNWPRVSP
jgi:hypothetical protein